MANLPLMKWSAFHKKQGDTVLLFRPKDLAELSAFSVKADLAYYSCIFSWNKLKALRIAENLFFRGIKVVGGGSGVDLDAQLPNEVEHIQPDYDLYGINYSMGFTSRGCIRKCPWCLIPKKEGSIRDHAPVSEFWNPRHKKIILLDNNFLASPKWKENLEFTIVNRLEVSICQGLDIRLINDETAKWLAILKARTPSFSGRDMLYFAFDNLGYEKSVRKGIEVLRAHGIAPRRLTFYVLCGFKSPEFQEEDMYRFNVLRELGVNPFIMTYRDPEVTRLKVDPLLKHFANWVNKPQRYKTCSFSEFERLSQTERDRLREMNIK